MAILPTKLDTTLWHFGFSIIFLGGIAKIPLLIRRRPRKYGPTPSKSHHLPIFPLVTRKVLVH
jgi:hypothetical protein